MRGATDRLVSGLVADLAPVRPLPRLRSGFAVVLSVWATLLGVVLLSHWHETSVTHGLGDGAHLASFVGLLVASFSATLSALAAGQPGRERTERAGLLGCAVGLLSAALACLIAMGARDMGAPPPPPGADAICFRSGVLLSLLPAGVLLGFLVRGWTARPFRASLVAALAAGGLGAAIVHLGCDVLAPRHLLVGHLSVPIVLGLLALYPVGVLLRRLRG